mgnify:CR=1 FL=1
MARPNFSIRVEGLENINKNLNELKKRGTDDVKEALHASAYNILSKAQSNLSSTPFAESVGGIMQSGFLEMTPDGYGFEVGFNKHYSPYIEYGTGDKVDVPAGFETYAIQFKGLGIRQVNIKPHPYFHPALNDELKNLRKSLRDLLKL